MTQDILVSIYVDDEDRTGQIRDWDIRWEPRQQALVLACHFRSGKSFFRPLSKCRVEPTRELGKTLLVAKGSAVASAADNVLIYGERYAVIRYTGSTMKRPGFRGGQLV